MTYPQHNPNPISPTLADAQAERIKAIMAETGLPFGPAVDKYIEEQHKQDDFLLGPVECATPRAFVHR